MTFQFLCPQGHLLQGEEAHMGMQCECPQCGTAFIIPTIGSASPAVSVEDMIAPVQSAAKDLLPPKRGPQVPASQSGVVVPGDDLDDDPIDIEPPARTIAARIGPDRDEEEDDDSVGSMPPLDVGLPATDLDESTLSEEVLHIPCPNGHVLETPLDMVGQRVLCPHCQVEFRLQREASSEYQRQLEILERKQGQLWFQVAILAASFVGVVLVLMIAWMIFSK